MKICFFNCARVWGGGENWHLSHAISFNQMGHEVVVASDSRSPLLQRAKAAGLRTRGFEISNLSFMNIFKLLSIYRFLRAEKFDVVILNFSKDLKTVSPMARLAGVRHIVYRRGSDIAIRNTLINRILFRHCLTHVIANSEATKRSILRNNPRLFPEEMIRVIYNGIDFEGFDNTNSRPSSKFTIGTIGRMAQQKRHDLLVEIAGKLRETGFECWVLIGGDGELHGKIRDMIDQRGLQDMVELTGFVENPHNYLQGIDIFVLTSEWEGFGYVLAEAMRAGKPIVAFDTSSVGEVVDNGNTGLLVPFGDIEAFAQAVRTLADDAELRRKMGMAGYERAHRLFNFDTNMRLVLDYLETPGRTLGK